MRGPRVGRQIGAATTPAAIGHHRIDHSRPLGPPIPIVGTNPVGASPVGVFIGSALTSPATRQLRSTSWPVAP